MTAGTVNRTLDVGRPLSSRPVLLSASGGPEAFSSHIDRTAAYQVSPLPVTALLARTGLTAADRHDALPYGYGIDLPADQVRRCAHVLGLEERQVREMLLRSLDGRAFDLRGLDVSDPHSVRAVAAREWAGFSGSACCPACLHEDGGWRRDWKLWFNFVCLKHQRLLLSRCPSCQRPTGNYRADQGSAPHFATHVPRPGRCANPVRVGAGPGGRAARPCGQDLGEVDTLDLRDAPRLLHTQRQLLSVLEMNTATVAGETVDALTYVRHLRSLVAMMLYIGQPEDLGGLPTELASVMRALFESRDLDRVQRGKRRGTAHHPYKAPPTDRRVTAAVLPWVCELLAQPDAAALTEALAPLISRVQAWRGRSARTVGQDFHFQGPLARALDDLLAPRATFDRTLGVNSGEQPGLFMALSPEHIPPLIRLDVYRRNFAPLLAGLNIGETPARATISMALVKLCGRHTWAQTVTLLGLDGHLTSANAGRVVGHLREHDRISTFQAALHKLATDLEAGPRIDFRAREQALRGFTTLTPEQWSEVVRRTGLRARKNGALRRNAAAWVWAQLVGSDPLFSPAVNSDLVQRQPIIIG